MGSRPIFLLSFCFLFWFLNCREREKEKEEEKDLKNGPNKKPEVMFLLCLLFLLIYDFSRIFQNLFCLMFMFLSSRPMFGFLKKDNHGV